VNRIADALEIECHRPRKQLPNREMGCGWLPIGKGVADQLQVGRIDILMPILGSE
jgi:hypothetical protein